LCLRGDLILPQSHEATKSHKKRLSLITLSVGTIYQIYLNQANSEIKLLYSEKIYDE